MGVIAIADFGGVSRNVATKLVGTTHYQNVDQPITTFHYVNDGSDSVNVVATAAYLRAVRIFNNAGYTVFLKLHDTSIAPTAGTGVVWAEGVAAGTHNPEPKLSAGGKFFSTGVGLSLVREMADAGTTAVDAGLVLIEIEYETYT